MFDLFLDLINNIAKHGLTWAALIGIITALYRHRKTVLKILHRGKEQETQLDQIQRDVRDIKEHLGVPNWDAERRFSSNDTVSRFTTQSQADGWFARFAIARTDLITRFTHTRRKNKMKKWLKPDSLTVFGGILAVAINRYFGFEIDPANILAAVVLLIGYFKAHELVIVVRDANGLPSGFRINSRKLIFTAAAFIAVVIDELFKLHLPTELLLTVVAAVTGYNYLEAHKDAKTAEAEGEEARQTY